jgi:GNAT superfamily N-acetyltransferase
MENDLVIRPVGQMDAQELSTLLNEIIARGGTTALEDPFEPSALADAMLTGPDIGTFARVGLTKKGVGSALFAAMQAEARNKGLTAINATIRADNSGGLAFYHRLGFVDHEIVRSVPLKDGTPVDRISKRYPLRS